MGKHAQSIEMKILRRIKGRGEGTVFTPRVFLDLGSRAAIDKALSRLLKSGQIRKLARGIYDLPASDDRFGLLHPSIETIVQAIAKRDRIKVLPTGALAANMLGLSDQVPIRIAYLTDGPYRRIRIGNRTIVFRRTTPRNMAVAGMSALLFQALRYLGRKNATPDLVRKVYERLTQNEIDAVFRDLSHAPGWIADVIATAADGFPASNYGIVSDESSERPATLTISTLNEAICQGADMEQTSPITRS